jgi:CelD/BcsL family acetyltransferase involved in cellulose biosynthesis
MSTLTAETETEVRSLEDDWRDLAERAAAPFFLYPDWVLRWHESFGRGRLSLVGVKSGGELVAAIPLDVGRLLARSPTNAHTPWFGVLATDNDAVARAAEHAFRARPFVSLGFLTDDARHVETTAARLNYRVAAGEFAAAPYVRITGDWSAYLERRPAKLMRDLVRRSRQLEQTGAVELDFVTHFEDAEFERLLVEGLAIEASGWKGEEHTAIVSEPKTERFYRAIARWARHEGWLRLVFLRVGTRPIAFHLALEQDRVYYLLKGGYDEAFRRYAPGKLLAQLTLRRAFDNAFDRYEFLGGPEPWKLEWADSVATLQNLRVSDRSLAGRILWLASQTAAPALRAARGRLRPHDS